MPRIANSTYISHTINSWTSDIQLSIQQSLLKIASQMGQQLDEVAAERLYQDSSILLDRIPCEPLTLASEGDRSLWSTSRFIAPNSYCVVIPSFRSS